MRKPKVIECFQKSHEVVGKDNPVVGYCTCHPGRIGLHVNGQHFFMTRKQSAVLATQLISHAGLEFAPRKRGF